MFPLVPSYVLHTIALSFVPGLDSDDEAHECDLLAAKFWKTISGEFLAEHTVSVTKPGPFTHTHTPTNCIL